MPARSYYHPAIVIGAARLMHMTVEHCLTATDEPSYAALWIKPKEPWSSCWKEVIWDRGM
jgi:hypothetical protein